MKLPRHLLAFAGLMIMLVSGVSASADTGAPPPPSTSDRNPREEYRKLAQVFWADVLPNYRRWCVTLGLQDSELTFVYYLQARRFSESQASVFLSLYRAHRRG